jgi:hypothetical protein
MLSKTYKLAGLNRKLVDPHKRYSRKPMTRGLRSWLPNTKAFTGGAALPVLVKQALLIDFPEIELIENPHTHKVDLYRVISRRNIYDDILVHEFTLKAPPGQWLIQHLKMHDAFPKTGADPKKQFNYYMKLSDRDDADKEAAFDKKAKEIGETISREWAFMLGGRKSISFHEGKVL